MRSNDKILILGKYKKQTGQQLIKSYRDRKMTHLYSRKQLVCFLHAFMLQIINTNWIRCFYVNCPRSWLKLKVLILGTSFSVKATKAECVLISKALFFLIHEQIWWEVKTVIPNSCSCIRWDQSIPPTVKHNTSSHSLTRPITPALMHCNCLQHNEEWLPTNRCMLNRTFWTLTFHNNFVIT